MLLPSTSDAIARGMSYDINRIVNIFIYIYIIMNYFVLLFEVISVRYLHFFYCSSM